MLGSTHPLLGLRAGGCRDTIVLVHGYRGDHHGLEPVIAQLPGIRFISPDLPGFGASTPLTEAPHSIAGYARWLTAFARALELPALAVILGHSFGSIVTSPRGRGRACRRRALILVNPISADPRSAAGRVHHRADPRLLRRRRGALPDRARHAAARQLADRAVHEHVRWSRPTTRRCAAGSTRSTTATSTASRDPRTVAEGFDASLSTAGRRGGAAACTMPVLLIAGEDDRIAPLAGQQRTRRAVPGCPARGARRRRPPHPLREAARGGRGRHPRRSSRAAADCA